MQIIDGILDEDLSDKINNEGFNYFLRENDIDV